MVRDQIEARGVRNPEVLRAMRTVPRHLFVPPALRLSAYDDTALAIGEGQTISQPYIVAFMTEALQVGPGDKVLEIGTGSGYQAAVLAEVVDEVYTIEVRPQLAERAEQLLKKLGYDNVHVRCGNGAYGWPEEAPFDGIIVTAAPDRVPDELLKQLRDGARMVIPLGREIQRLHVITRRGDAFEDEAVLGVRFVPFAWTAQS